MCLDTREFLVLLTQLFSETPRVHICLLKFLLKTKKKKRKEGRKPSRMEHQNHKKLKALDSNEPGAAGSTPAHRWPHTRDVSGLALLPCRCGNSNFHFNSLKENLIKTWISLKNTRAESFLRAAVHCGNRVSLPKTGRKNDRKKKELDRNLVRRMNSWGCRMRSGGWWEVRERDCVNQACSRRNV